MYDFVYYLSATAILVYLTFAASAMLFLEVKMWIDDRRHERDCARQLRDHKILVASQQRELDKMNEEYWAEEQAEQAEKEQADYSGWSHIIS